MSNVNPLVCLLRASFWSVLLLSGLASSSVANSFLNQPLSPSVNSLDRPQGPLSPKFYSQEQINYFLEIAFSSEFGSQSNTIKKWNQDINIQVYGSPTSTDLATLRSVIDEINGLQRSIRLTLTKVAKTKSPQTSMGNLESNLEIHFVPESKFKRIEPNYQPTNLGFFWTNWHQNLIENARILISTTRITPQERSHLIREELTQSLGLMKDSYRYPQSIFYQGWTATNEYAEIDRNLVEMLYRPEIKPGMTKAEVLAVFRQMNAQRGH